MDTSGRPVRGDQRFMPRLVRLLNMTFRQWLQDKAPQLGAALAYYTVFSLAPLMLVLLAVFGMVYGNSEVARREILHQLYAFLDRSSAKAVEDIATSTGKPAASTVATMVGIAVALFGASGVFGQLQDALRKSSCRRRPIDVTSEPEELVAATHGRAEGLANPSGARTLSNSSRT
jgi:uncharacterized BrkB/YihY/UPF0761 family membrane protein